MTPERATFGLAQASRRWWLVLCVLVGASVFAYRGRNPGALQADTRFGGPAQGTTYSVVLPGTRSPDAVAALQAAVDSVIAGIDTVMSTYDPSSELSRLNRDARTAPIAVSPALANVLQIAAQVSRDSRGAFDVTVAPLINAWGFGPDGDVTSAPDSATLSALRERVGWQRLAVSDGSVTKMSPLVEVDLNAIAPGYTVDRIVDLLIARGEPAHLVELGGELRASGRNARGLPFRVGIEEPDSSRRAVRLVVGLQDRALATSGNYRDFRDVNGVRYVHTLDPSTGRPVTHRLLAVSVLHAQCAFADAWATALLVVGPERAWALAEEHDLDVLLLIAGASGKVEQRLTPGFASAVLPNDTGARTKESR